MIAFIIDNGNWLLACPSRHEHGDGQSNSVIPAIRNKQLHSMTPSLCVHSGRLDELNLP
jgi:hypothetical protein